MKLRYLTTMNKVTAQEVEAYATEHNVPKLMAKQLLENRIGPVLEYYDEDYSIWREVEHITEYLE